MIQPFAKLTQLNLALRAFFRERVKRGDRIAAKFLKGLAQDEPLIRFLEELVAEYYKKAQLQSVRIGPTAKRASQDAMGERRFLTPQDRKAAEKGKEREYLAEAMKEVLAAIEQKYGARGAELAAKAIEWRQELRRELEKKKFEASSPSMFLGMTPAEAAELDGAFLEIKGWPPKKMVEWVTGAVRVLEPNDPQLRRCGRLLLRYIDHFEQVPLAERAVKSGRSGSATADQAAVGQLKALLKLLEASRAADDANDELEVYLQKLEEVDFEFKLMCGIHVPQLSRPEFTRLYLTAGNTPKPYTLSHGWLTRYCNPENLAHLNKAIEGVASFNTDIPAPASNKGNANPPKPKAPTQPPFATGQGKSQLAKGERLQRLDPSRAQKPFSRRVVG